MSNMRKMLMSGGTIGTAITANARAGTDFTPTQREANEGITRNELIAAYDRLMSGPRSQRPTQRAVRKTIHRLKRGLSVDGPWRSWPA